MLALSFQRGPWSTCIVRRAQTRRSPYHVMHSEAMRSLSAARDWGRRNRMPVRYHIMSPATARRTVEAGGQTLQVLGHKGRLLANQSCNETGHGADIVKLNRNQLYEGQARFADAADIPWLALQ